MLSSSSNSYRRDLAALCLALACLVLPLFALALLGPADASAAGNRDVKRAMNALSGGAGSYAYNITDKKAIAGRNQNRTRIIASNAKLFTAATALRRFGTGGRFATAIYSDGSRDGSTLTGDLYLRGGGDPLFGNASYVTEYFGSRATLELLAEEFRDAGIRKVTGKIYGDEAVFDARRGTAYSGWARNGDIGGVLGGLIVNKGFVGSRYQANPPVFAAQRLRAALRARGVAVGSATGAKSAPRGAERIAAVRSLPISALVRQMNKPSNNYLAEMLAKTLALPPAAADDDADGGEVPIGSAVSTTARGSAVARRFSAGLGSRITMVDGSGLSRGNRAAPREVVDLLRGMERSVAFVDFRASLPIAGVDGTLANRMRRTAAYRNCQAKTGTLSNVATLSGYCTSAGGDTIAFSILQNTVSPAHARAQQDRVVRLIAALQ